MKTFIGLLASAGLAATSLGCGTFAQCEALCGSEVIASGTVEIPAGNPPLTVTLCLDDQCGSCRAVDQGGALRCEDDGVGLVDEGDGRFRLQPGFSYDEPTLGQVVKVTFAVEETGEKLVDAQLPVRRLTEDELCGTVCHDAEVSWDE